MKKVNFSKKQGGFILTSEAILLSTVLVIGLTAGLVTVRDAMNAEMEDVAEAIGNLDQTYAFNGIANAEGTAAIAGSAYGDAVDAAAGDGVTFAFTATDLLEGDATVSAVSAGSASEQATGTAVLPAAAP